HLIKMWLECPVEETDDRGRKTRTTEARDKRRGCQSAFKFDPASASNFDPFGRRVLAVALAPSELVGVAETVRARAACSSSRLLKRQLSLPVSTMSPG